MMFKTIKHSYFLFWTFICSPVSARILFSIICPACLVPDHRHPTCLRPSFTASPGQAQHVATAKHLVFEEQNLLQVNNQKKSLRIASSRKSLQVGGKARLIAQPHKGVNRSRYVFFLIFFLFWGPDPYLYKMNVFDDLNMFLRSSTKNHAESCGHYAKKTFLDPEHI